MLGRALLVRDLLDGLSSLFAFVYFSGLKGLHQGLWSQQQNPNVASLGRIGQKAPVVICTHSISFLVSQRYLKNSMPVVSTAMCCFQSF